MVDAQASEPTQLRLLGRFLLVSGLDVELLVSAPRQRALIAYLALQPDFTASREQLSTLLWGDTDDRYARQNLRQIVSRLRRELAILGPDFIIADREFIRIGLPLLHIDVREFERATSATSIARTETAIDLYGGDFLEGFSCGAEGFEEWAEQERARLKIAYRAVVERYLDDPAADPARAVAAATRVANADPFDERGQRLLLQALAKHYGADAAATQADHFIKQLQRELGVAPDAETQALIAQIRAQAPSPEAIAGAPPLTARFFENVPPRDLNFTGRSAGLETLRAFLQDSLQPTAIHGLGGIGKTALAAEYAHRFSDDYAGVCWANAAQRTLLVESLASFAGEFDPKLASEPDHEKAAVAGLTQLSRLSKPFLLIYDNVDSPETVQGLIPSIGAHVIITSRWADWSGRAAELKLDAFDEDVAVEFLQKRAACVDAQGAKRLAAALGRLPLALDHAGAYCKLTRSGFDPYLERIDARIARAPKGVAYPASVAATFGLAVETANAQHEFAEALLGFFAYLSPEGIPLSLATDAIIPEYEREEALAALYVVSLVEHDSSGEDPIVSLHPLVQAAMRFRLTERGRAADMIAQATGLLADEFPTSAINDPKTWPKCAMLLRHALALRDLAGWSPEAGEVASRLLHSAASYLYVRGAYAEAEPLFREAIAIAQEAFGREHPDVANKQNSLALLLTTTGRYDEAEPIFRQTIESGEKMLGRRHLDVAMRLANLARLLSDTKRYADAEPLYREAITIADEHVGVDYPYALAWRNNLGILLNETGRNAEGETFYREALAIGERTLGVRHHEMARCMNNLGRLLRDVDRMEEAEALVRDALRMWWDMLGEEHSLPARGQENLANILLHLGRVDEALSVAHSALRIHESKLGLAHFWTRDSARTYAIALDLADRRGEASTLRKRYGLPAVNFLAAYRARQTAEVGARRR
ncbi:tetratricopeptide repeat protein [Terrarubrum flagellatum]|uniref:tetratricopeptide repeat protein n=1 Tax=Terrirubrum flagellatum TaxID=2895980 RepID=UPI003145544A